DDYLNQMRPVADRFEIFRPSFYISNVLHEVNRYRPIGMLNPSGQLGWFRPGAWTVLPGVPAAVGLMLWRTRNRAHDATFTLASAALVQVVLFAFLLKMKMYAYLIALWPLGALALAWLAVWLWNTKKVATTMRVVLPTLLALILVEGAVRISHTW